MTQRYKLDTNVLGQWFKIATGLAFLFDLVQICYIISVLSLLPKGNSCSSFLTPFFTFPKTNWREEC